MKKQIILALGVLAIAVSAHANTYSDADYFGGKSIITNKPNGVTLGPSAVQTGSFSFLAAGDSTNDGFTIAGSPYPVPTQGTFSSALGFVVGSETIDIDSVEIRFWLRSGTGAGFEILVPDSSYTLTWNNFNFFYSDTFGGTAQIQGDVDTTGSVNYSITNTGSSGSFILDGAWMSVGTVPDGGSTLALLGCVLVGVEGLRRRFALA